VDRPSSLISTPSSHLPFSQALKLSVYGPRYLLGMFELLDVIVVGVCVRPYPSPYFPLSVFPLFHSFSLSFSLSLHSLLHCSCIRRHTRTRTRTPAYSCPRHAQVALYEAPSLLDDLQCMLSATNVSTCPGGGIGASVLRMLRMLRFGKLLGKYPVIQARPCPPALLLLCSQVT
jgi:hypothetical protein